MAAIKTTPLSITDIEKQIAKVSAELAKARAKEFAAAEKIFFAAQKATDAARARFDKLQAKSGSDSGDARLQKAQEDLDHQEALLAEASNAYELVKVKQDAAEELASTIASLGNGDAKAAKKPKVTKGEKKAQKKQSKQDAKAEKKAAKDEAKAAKEAKKQAKKAEKKMKGKKASEAVTEEASQPDATQSEATQPAVAKKSPARKKAAPKVAPEQTPSPAEIDLTDLEDNLDDKAPAVEEPDTGNSAKPTVETETPAESGMESLTAPDERDSEETPNEGDTQHGHRNDYSVE